jgi:HNH endonuclease
MFEAGQIISYQEMCHAEGASLQRGMNFRLKEGLSVILMSQRKNAPYLDNISKDGCTLVYEGHDTPKSKDTPIPKNIDQPEYTPNNKFTQNGLFNHAAQTHKKNGIPPEQVRVYEKILTGIWCYNGLFDLTDSWKEDCGKRKVFKFKLKFAEVLNASARKKTAGALKHDRIIPSNVKLEVWKRDQGKCVICGEKDNLHFDHIIPFSKGGSSIVAENIQLLCARHNLEKRDKIE